jgi:hypothetical protein
MALYGVWFLVGTFCQGVTEILQVQISKQILHLLLNKIVP